MHCYMPKISITIITFLHFLIGCLSECRSQCGTIPINYPLSIDDGCGAPQFRNMFTCNTSALALFFNTPNGNYKVQSIDYKAQTLTVYDPDMSTCTVLQPHHDLHLSDVQYAIIPPSSDTVFALLNCSVDSPILHRYSSLCFEFAGHKCPELYSSCNSFRVFTTGGLVNPGAGNNTGPDGYFYGGSGGGGGGGGGGGNFNTSTGFSTGGSSSNNSNNNMGFESPSGGFGPPSGGFGSGVTGSSGNNNMGAGPPGGGFGTGVSGSSGNNNNNMGAAPPSGGLGTGGTDGSSSNNMGAGVGTGAGIGAPGVGGGAPSPPCCFTGYSTLKVMSMDILDCTHFTSFYDVDKLKGVGPMDWSYGLKFSYSVPDMGCERCTKSGGSCGFDVQTEALLCLCPGSNNSTRQCDLDKQKLGVNENWEALSNMPETAPETNLRQFALGRRGGGGRGRGRGRGLPTAPRAEGTATAQTSASTSRPLIPPRSTRGSKRSNVSRPEVSPVKRARVEASPTSEKEKGKGDNSGQATPIYRTRVNLALKKPRRYKDATDNFGRENETHFYSTSPRAQGQYKSNAAIKIATSLLGGATCMGICRTFDVRHIQMGTGKDTWQSGNTREQGLTEITKYLPEFGKNSPQPDT